MNSFKDLGVPSPVVNVLNKSGKTTPFPIQSDTLPDSLAGRDILGRGQTGSGKTLAFSIPMVARLSNAAGKRKPSHPRGLILAPTRELATQIAEEIKPLASVYGLRVTTVFGGVSQRPQEKALKAGADIVVACPGRLEDLMNQRVISVDQVEIAVLDEADHMADLGFLPAVTRIMAATPEDGQRMLFSATLDKDVNKIVRRFLHDPARHEVDSGTASVDSMSHHVLVVKNPDEKNKLVEQLASGRGRRVMFTRTKHQAERLAGRLNKAGIPAVDLHGNLSQRVRDKNLAAFAADPRRGGVRVLVATDVAARGVHVNDVEMVVHVDPPAEHKAYLHRSGRTARAGADGTVVTLAFANQRREVAKILKGAAVEAEPEFVSPGSPAVAALVGKPADPQAERAAREIQDAVDEREQRRGARRKPKGQGNRNSKQSSNHKGKPRNSARPKSQQSSKPKSQGRRQEQSSHRSEQHDHRSEGRNTEQQGRRSERQDRHNQGRRTESPRTEGRRKDERRSDDRKQNARPKRNSSSRSQQSSRPSSSSSSRSEQSSRTNSSSRTKSSRPGQSTRNGKSTNPNGSRAHNKKKPRHSQKRRAAAAR